MSDKEDTSTAIATMPNDGGGLYPGLDMRELYKFCRAVVVSDMVPPKNPEQAMMIILAGREYGLSPMAALMNGHIIKGKFTLSADMMAAVATSKGARIELIETTAERATYRLSGAGRDTPIDFTFDIDDAKRARLYPGKSDSNWSKYPKSMLRARAVSQGIRAAFPGMMSGAYLSDEMTEAVRAVATVTASTSRPTGLDALGVGDEEPAQIEDRKKERDLEDDAFGMDDEKPEPVKLKAKREPEAARQDGPPNHDHNYDAPA